MPLTITNDIIKKHLIQSFALLDEWFDKDESFLFVHHHQLETSIACTMHNINIANQHFISLVCSQTASVKNQGGEYVLNTDELEEAVLYWEMPLEKKSIVDLSHLRYQLRDQLYQTLVLLELDIISISDESTWDVYHKLYFMSLLIRKYVTRFKTLTNTYVANNVVSII